MNGETETIGPPTRPVSLTQPLLHSQSTRRLVLVAWLVVTDLVVLSAAFALAYWLRFGLQITVAPEITPDPEDYRILTAWLIPLWLTVFVLFDLYEPPAKLAGAEESSRVFNASATATMLVMVVSFLLPTFVISRMWLISSWLLSFAFVTANRFLARRIVYFLRRRGHLLSPAVIVGTNPEAFSLASHLGESAATGLWTVGFVTTDAAEPVVGTNIPVLGSVSEIDCIVKQYGVEEVVVAITDIRREELLRLCETVDALPVQLRLSSGLYELLTTRVSVQTLGTVPLMSLQKNRLDRSEVLVKTVLDWSVATLVLFVFSPILAAIAVAIRLDSRGPIIHRRRVLGVGGSRFDALKFRTMYVNGDELLNQDPDGTNELRVNHKLKSDPRVTRVGRWLRRYSLDELPQLFNVLAGQMSLVGPRMISPEEAEKYGRHRMNLFTVKPGLTGLWQVSGRSDLSYGERVQMDMYYVRTYSVWLDLQILFVQTLPAVLKGKGAY